MGLLVPHMLYALPSSPFQMVTKQTEVSNTAKKPKGKKNQPVQVRVDVGLLLAKGTQLWVLSPYGQC